MSSEEENNNKSFKGFGSFGGFKNIGQSIRQQAEELNSMAREAAKKVEDFQTRNQLLSDNTPSSPNRKPTALGKDAEKEEERVLKENDKDKGTEEQTAAVGSSDEQALNPSLASRDPSSVSKEELIEILQKMNQRVKALAAVKMQLVERVKAVEDDKSRLVDLVKNEILSNVDLEEEFRKNQESINRTKSQSAPQNGKSGEEMDEIKMIQLAWRAADERNQLSLQQLQNEYKAVSMEYQEQVEKVKKEAQDEINLQVEKKVAEWIASNSGCAGDVDSDGGPIVKTNQDYSLCQQELDKSKEDLLRLETEVKEMELNQSKQVEAMVKKHEEYVNQVKQEAAEDKAKSIAKLKEIVKEKLIAMKTSYEEKIRSLSEPSTGADGLDQAAVDTIKNEHEKQMNELKAQLDEACAQIKVYEEQLASVRDELQNEHQVKMNNLQEQFVLKENEWKEEMEKAAMTLTAERLAINDRIQEALENSSESTQNLEKLELAQREFENKMNEIHSLHQQELLREKTEVASLLQKLDEIELSHSKNIQSLKESHDQEVERLQEKAKQSLMEMESSYESKMAAFKEEYGSKQDVIAAQLRKDFESEISRLKSEHDMALTQIAMDKEKEAADKYARDLTCAREDTDKAYRDILQTMKDNLVKEKNEEIQSLKEKAEEHLHMAVTEETDKFSMMKDEFEVKILEMQSAHDEEVKALESEAATLAARIQELEVVHSKELELIKNEAKSEIDAIIVRQKNDMNSATTELKVKYDNETEELRKMHDEEITRIREEHTASLDALAQGAGEETKQLHHEEVNKLKEQMQQSHSVEMEKLRSDINHLKAELNERVLEAYKEGEKKAAESENETIIKVKRSYEDKIVQLQSMHEKEMLAVTNEAKSLSCRLKDLETCHSKEISLLNQEHAKTVDAIRSDIEKEKATSLEEMKHEMEQKLVMVELSYEEKLSSIVQSKEMQIKLDAELTKNDALTQEYSELLASFNETKEMNETLESRLSQVETDRLKSIDSLKNKCDILEEEKMKIGDKMEKVVANEQIHLGRIEQLEKELTTRETNFDQLSRELKDKSEIILTENRNIDELHETIQAMKAQNSSLSELNINLEHEVTSIRNSLENLKLKASSREILLKQITQENEELKVSVREAKEEIASLIQSHQNDIASLQEEVSGTRESLKRINEEHALEMVRIKEEGSTSATISSEEIAKIREEANRQISEEQQKYHVMSSDFEVRLKNLQLEMDNALKSTEETKEKARLKLTQAAEERQILINEHFHAISTLQRQLDATNAQNNEVNTLEEIHRNDIMKLKTQYEEKISKLENSIASERTMAESERKSFLQKITSLEKQMSDSLSSIDGERDRIKTEVTSYYDKKIKEILDENDVKKKEIVEKLTVKFNEKLQAAIGEHEQAKADLKDKMAQHTDELRLHFEEKMHRAKADFDAIKSQLEADNIDMRQKLSICEEKLLSVQEDKDTLKQQLQVEMTSAAKLQNLLDASKKELLDSQSNNEATTESFLAQEENMQSEINQLEKQVYNLQKELSTKTRQNEEVGAKLISLQRNLDELCNQKEEMEEKLEVSSKQVAKLNAMEKEVEKSREELNSFRLELSQKSALLLRLQAEQEASEKTHGQRTAIVGMLETQLSELNEANTELQAKLEVAIYDLRQKDDDLQNASADIEQLRRDLEEVTGKLETTIKNSSERNSKLISEQDYQEKSSLVSSLQKEISLLQQQMAKKSSTAQRLLQQCEAECQELKNRNKKLQHELDKGSFSEQRIFELAAQQSNHESLATSEINIRNQMVERLADKLQSHDDELASTEYAKKQIEREVEELSRIHRREDVNLDYLKSTIVQFLSKPPGSSERVALLPVIATLLQFDSDDYKLIEQGRAKVNWFGSVLPTVITSPGTQDPARSTHDAQPLLPQSVSSAEVTIADRNPQKRVGRTSGTSLQF